jgi:serine/threonine-protein kinase
VFLPWGSGARRLGALAVGDRQDGTNLTAADLRLLERVRGRLSQQLDYLHQENEARLRARRIVDLYPDFPPQIGPFQIERVLGEGGTSFVYLGRNVAGPAAIKVPNDKVQSNERAMQRFRRESLAMQRLEHPHIARIVEVGWHGREPYIAFEYFPAGSLDVRLAAGGPLAERYALDVSAQVVAALRAAHEAGILHRDVKLRNLFLVDETTVKLGDFGLALVEDATTLTTHPMLMGTPAYMSPEQALGKPATWRSDQYSLGICLYELLAGERPFSAETAEVLLFLHVHQPLPDITDVRPEVTPATRRLIERMTAKDPRARFESYAALDSALRR